MTLWQVFDINEDDSDTKIYLEIRSAGHFNKPNSIMAAKTVVMMSRYHAIIYQY